MTYPGIFTVESRTPTPSQVWLYAFVMSAPRELRQEDYFEFKLHRETQRDKNGGGRSGEDLSMLEKSVEYSGGLRQQATI